MAKWIGYTSRVDDSAALGFAMAGEENTQVALNTSLAFNSLTIGATDQRVR